MESAEPQRLLILSGVVGSGKTTLAEAIVKEMPNYARVSQDDLGNRQACESLVRRRLKEVRPSLSRFPSVSCESHP